MITWVRDRDGAGARRALLIGLVAVMALGLQQPIGVVLVLPVLVAAALAQVDRAPGLRGRATIDVVNLLEDDVATVVVELHGSGLVDVGLQVQTPLAPDVDARTVLVRDRATVRFTVRARTWGVATAGPVRLRRRAAGGAVWSARIPVVPPAGQEDAAVNDTVLVLAHPAPLALPLLPVARTTTRSPGVHPSREVARGVEFADLRPHQPGDHLRDVNWRASARRGELWVSQRHPDRRQDVVVLVDTFDGYVLPDAVRLAYGVAAAALGRRDRVGVIGFGGILRWLAPGGGDHHRVRVEQALVASRAAVSAAWKDLRLIPPRTLPTHALVLAITPLAEERSRRALADLCARGREVVVIDVGERSARRREDALVDELDGLLRESYRDALRRDGATVEVWRGEEPAAAALARAAVAHRPRTRR